MVRVCVHFFQFCTQPCFRNSGTLWCFKWAVARSDARLGLHETAQILGLGHLPVLSLAQTPAAECFCLLQFQFPEQTGLGVRSNVRDEKKKRNFHLEQVLIIDHPTHWRGTFWQVSS